MFKKLLYAFLILFAIGTASFAAVTYPVSLAISPKDMFAAPDSAVGYVFIPDTTLGSSRLLIRKVYNDTTAPAPVATFPLPGRPFGVAVSPNGEKAYVAVSGATQSIKVYSLNILTGTWTEDATPILFSGFRGLRGLAVSPDGKRLYAADALANKVHVIDTASKTVIDIDPASPTIIDGINIPVASDVYGVAVSPDNALLAVTRKTTTGSLFVYRIDRELDGTISYPLLWSQTTGLYYPNYPIFSPDSKRLYVRVHELSGSYNDVYFYENPNRTTAPTPLSIRVPYDVATSEAYAGNNRGGEAMTLSSNGQFLYLIHFQVWNTWAGKTTQAHFYRVSNLNADGSLRTDYSQFLSPTNPELSLSLNEGLMSSTPAGTPSPYDGMAASPDGSRVWYSSSDGAPSDPYNCASLRFTGFTAYPSGVLTNAIPGEPGIVHPASASGDDLNNYTSGAVEWTNGVDDSGGPYHFEVSYKRTSASTWTTPTGWGWLDSGTDRVTLPSSLSNNQWYVVQVRMHDGTYWSDPAFSELFKKSFPTITSIEVDTDRGTPTRWEGYDSATNIGYIYDTIKIKGSGFGAVSSPWTNGDGDHNQIQFGIPDKFGNYYYEVIPGQEGTNRRIISWADNEIIMIVPRAFKDGTVFKANNVRVKVKANDLLSAFKAFRVGPVITNMTPVSGLAGDAMVTITGAGFGGVTGTDDVYFFDNQLTTINSRVSGADYEQFVVPAPATATTGRVIVRANGFDSSINYQGSPHGTYNEPVIFTVTGVAVQNVVVTSPNGGETLTAGSAANITWTSSGITNVRIRYSVNGGLHWGVVTASTPAAIGTYSWPVPPTPTTQGRIEISDAGDNSPLDTSDANFTIQESGGGPQVLIDDFEGGTVDPTTGYFAPFGTNPVTRTRQSTVVDSGSYAMQALYSWTGGDPSVNWGGGWGGSLRTNQNIGITGLDRVKFRVRGDAGLNVTTYFIQVRTTDDKDYRSVTKTLPATTSWTTEEALYTQMWNEIGATPNGAPDPGEELFSARTDKTIKSYSIVYNGHNTTPLTANHYIDNIVAASSGVQPSSISTAIARAGDTVGSGISLSWTVSDGYAGTYNIYRKSGAWDAADGVFTTTAASWGTPWRSGVMSPVTDDTQVGQGTQTYYKVVKSADTLTDAMLLTDVVGKFDLAVGPSDTQPEKFFISLPLVPIAPRTDSLVDVFGAQVGEGDGILTFNMNKDVLTGSLYSGGAWAAFPGSPAITNVSWGRAYGYLTMTEKYLTVVGKVPESANLLSLTGGWDGVHDYAAVAEWIANSYPVPVTITTSALGSSTSRGTSPLDGGTVYQFNASADLMGGVDGMAVNTAAGWVSGTLTDPSTLRLVPGRGYMLNEPVNSAFTWAQPKPY